MSANFFTGTGVAMVTPFHADGNIDWENLQKIIHFLSEGKVEYLVIMGTTGENVTISKEEKQDLMHIAVCSLFRQSGYYELEGVDEEGWPHFRQLKALPVMGLIEQENFLKDHILLFFENTDLEEKSSDGLDEL